MVQKYCPRLLPYCRWGTVPSSVIVRNPLWCGGKEDLLGGDFLERGEVVGSGGQATNICNPCLPGLSVTRCSFSVNQKAFSIHRSILYGRDANVTLVSQLSPPALNTGIVKQSQHCLARQGFGIKSFSPSTPGGSSQATTVAGTWVETCLPSLVSTGNTKMNKTYFE